MSSHVYATLAITFGIIFICLCVYLLSRYQRTAYIFWFSMFVLLLAAWTISNGLIIFLPSQVDIDFFGRLPFFFIGLACPVFYLFAKNFPFSETRTRPDEYLILFFPSILVMSALFFSKQLLVSFGEGSFRYSVYGSLFWMYILYILGMAAGVAVLLASKLKAPESYQRSYTLQIFVTTVVTVLVGTFGSLILPFFFHAKENEWSILFVSTIWVVFLCRVVFLSSKRDKPQI